MLVGTLHSNATSGGKATLVPLVATSVLLSTATLPPEVVLAVVLPVNKRLSDRSSWMI